MEADHASPEGLRALSEFQSSLFKKNSVSIFSQKKRRKEKEFQSSVSMFAFKGCMFPVEEDVS